MTWLNNPDAKSKEWMPTADVPEWIVGFCGAQPVSKQWDLWFAASEVQLRSGPVSFHPKPENFPLYNPQVIARQRKYYYLWDLFSLFKTKVSFVNLFNQHTYCIIIHDIPFVLLTVSSPIKPNHLRTFRKGTFDDEHELPSVRHQLCSNLSDSRKYSHGNLHPYLHRPLLLSIPSWMAFQMGWLCSCICLGKSKIIWS